MNGPKLNQKVFIAMYVLQCRHGVLQTIFLGIQRTNIYLKDTHFVPVVVVVVVLEQLTVD